MCFGSNLNSIKENMVSFVDDEVEEIYSSGLITNSPVVSVHMITYNHEQFVADAIESVVCQKTDFPFELIIGEDCSTDSTRAIILEYQKKYPHIITILSAAVNVGAHKNFNRVLSKCKGKYIAFCEGDDAWGDECKLSKQVKFLDKNPEYVATYHDFNICRDGEIFSMDDENIKIRDTTPQELALGGGGIQTLTICFRNVIDELPIEFYKVVGGDIFFRSLLGGFGAGKYLKDINPGNYNIHSGGAWSGLNEVEQLVCAVETSCWIAAYYKRIGNYEFASRYACSAMSRITKVLVSNNIVFIKWFLRHCFAVFIGDYLLRRKK